MSETSEQDTTAVEPTSQNGAETPPLTEEGPETPPTASENKARGTKISSYGVFYLLGAEYDPPIDEAQQALEDGDWKYLGKFQVQGNGGQKEARRQAVEATGELRERIVKGEKVFFFCVPFSSLTPRAVFSESRDPRLVF